MKGVQGKKSRGQHSWQTKGLGTRSNTNKDQAETQSHTFLGADLKPPLPRRQGWSMPHPPSTSACTDTNNTEVTDWRGIKIRKRTVGIPSPQKSEGQAAGKLTWGLQGLRSSWLPGFSPPCTPDNGGNERESWIRGGCQQGTGLGDLGETVLENGDRGTFPSPHCLIQRSHSTTQHSGPPSLPFP